MTNRPNIIRLLWTMLFSSFIILGNAQQDRQLPSKKVYTTSAINTSISPEIDGNLTDEAWNTVNWEGDFIQREPNEKVAPSEATSFKIIYDEKNLYVGIRCLDSEPDKIEKRLGRRDGFEGDWVEINIDSYHDLQTAFSFTVTAAGVKGDELISRDGNNWDSSWNPIWFVKTNSDEKGWYAEMKIPLSQLRFGKNEEQVWGLQFTRRLFKKAEKSNWQCIPRDESGWVSNFGELKGLKNLKAQKQVEIQPFILGSVSNYQKEERNPYKDGNDQMINAGIDGKIGITNDLTLDFTVNPDFGQVEADPAAIALDGFQIFFREQRPFFVENKNIFNFNVSGSAAGNTFGNDNLFYSRRIGKSPSHYPSVSSDAYLDLPSSTSILGAAKFSGKTKNGLSLGILESVTSREFASIQHNGEESQELIEPLSNYFVGRVTKDLNERNSNIGAMITNTSRNIEGDLDFLHTNATTGGIDFFHKWDNRSWQLTGDIIFSNVQGSTNSITNTQRSIGHLYQRVDADHLEVDTTLTNLSGTGGILRLGKFGGDLNFETGVTWRTPGLELNDIGFQRQADDIRHFTWCGYKWREPFSIFRYMQANYNHWIVSDFEGNLNSIAWNINWRAIFTNNSNFGIGTNISPYQFSNNELRGGPRFRYVPEIGFWMNGNTDERKKLRGGFHTYIERAQQKANSFYVLNLYLKYQPTNRLNFLVGPRFSNGKNELQYITERNFEGNPEFIVGDLDQNTVSFEMRVNATINPNLTIQLYAEPFSTRVNYSDFKRIINPLSSTLLEKAETFDESQLKYNDEVGNYSIDQNRDGTADYYLDQPDFAYSQIRSNLVVRWEYKPGSELFFVWSHNNGGLGDPSSSLSQIMNTQFLETKGENILLLKGTYRLSL